MNVRCGPTCAPPRPPQGMGPALDVRFVAAPSPACWWWARACWVTGFAWFLLGRAGCGRAAAATLNPLIGFAFGSSPISILRV